MPRPRKIKTVSAGDLDLIRRRTHEGRSCAQISMPERDVRAARKSAGVKMTRDERIAAARAAAEELKLSPSPNLASGAGGRFFGTNEWWAANNRRFAAAFRAAHPELGEGRAKPQDQPFGCGANEFYYGAGR